MIGTPAYMSPEQARGWEIDARTDIFSLGIVLYEMIAGRPPFAGPTASHVLISILEQDQPPLAQYTRAASAGLEGAVRKALAKDREERYQTVKGLLIDLRLLQQRLKTEEEPRPVEVTSGRKELPSRKPRSRAGDASIAVLPLVNDSADPMLLRHPAAHAGGLRTSPQLRPARRQCAEGVV